jgi:hypothetical protein
LVVIAPKSRRNPSVFISPKPGRRFTLSLVPIRNRDFSPRAGVRASVHLIFICEIVPCVRCRGRAARPCQRKIQIQYRKCDLLPQKSKGRENIPALNQITKCLPG